MKHIGMDVHSTTTDACVRNGKGIVVLQRRMKTTQSELVEFIESIRGDKRVVLEEDQMADWITRLLQPYVNEIIRCQPQYNKLISSSEDKCDKMDARSLSELPYLDRIKPVHHPEMKYRVLREAARAYWVASRDLTRAKNRLKGWYLFNGVYESGRSIYSLRNRNRSNDCIPADAKAQTSESSVVCAFHLWQHSAVNKG